MTLVCCDDLPAILPVDLRGIFGHISVLSYISKFKNHVARKEFMGECKEMDTNSFDKQAKQHLKVYENVMFAAKICIVAIIVTLVVMAATLV